MKHQLLIITGSKHDLPRLSEVINVLKTLKISYDVRVVSCHRNLRQLTKLLNNLQPLDYEIILAVARSVANLPAVIAGYLKSKIIPVIGVGLSDKKFNGIDSLLSINTIPKGVPLLNTGLDEIGLYNACLAIAMLLSQKNVLLKKRLIKYLKK